MAGGGCLDTPELAEYSEWTTSPDNVPGSLEPGVRVVCTECDSGEAFLTPREPKTDGSVADSAHIDGCSILSVICGDGCAGEDAMHNVWPTFVTLKWSWGVF